MVTGLYSKSMELHPAIGDTDSEADFPGLLLNSKDGSAKLISNPGDAFDSPVPNQEAVVTREPLQPVARPRRSFHSPLPQCQSLQGHTCRGNSREEFDG